jgi:hypothetical protein
VYRGESLGQRATNYWSSTANRRSICMSGIWAMRRTACRGLLYPLKIWDPERPSHDLVRTVLAINREARSMIFAGDVPQGSKAQLMRGEFTGLAAGATEAASQAAAKHSEYGLPNGLALLVSCIGRRLLMGQRIEDEIRSVNEVLPPVVSHLGFYSYGEIAPHSVSGVCDLHNQTMTITVISEDAA